MTILELICMVPFNDITTACPFFIRESMVKGGNPMLAWQVRVDPSFFKAALISVSKKSSRSAYHWV